MEANCNRHFPLFRNVKKAPSLFPGILFQRQLEAMPEIRFRSRILKSKLQKLKCAELTLSQFLDVYYGSALSIDGLCQLITPCDAFLGAWTTGKYPDQTLFIDVFHPDLVINEYGMEERLRHANVMRNCQIVDICDVDSGGIHFTSYIAYSLDNGTTHFQVVPRRDHTTMHDRTVELRAMRLEFNTIQLYNCIWNSYSKTLALGSNLGVITYIGLDGLGSLANDPWVFGEKEARFAAPYCQDFDQKGCLLYIGFIDGIVSYADRRCPGDSFTGEIHVGGDVSHIKLLSDERSLIVSAGGNKLCYVDTRMNSVLFSYPYHQNKNKRVPFCTEESLDVICSSGEDYITRYWNLKGGQLLAEYHPPFYPDGDSYIYSAIRDTGSGMRSHIFLGNEIHCMEPEL